MRNFNNLLALQAFFFICLFFAQPSILLAQNSEDTGLIIRQVHFGSSSTGASETSYDLNSQNESESDFDLELIKSMIQDNIPTIFLSGSDLKDENEKNPVRLITDANSLSMLENQNPRFRSIKFLQVDINQVRDKSLVILDSEKLKAFSNLSFVFIKSNIPLSKEEVNLMLKGYDQGDVVLLYQVNSNF